MKILVTAGNTQVPIDRVRCITNIFSGRTGTRINAARNRLVHWQERHTGFAEQWLHGADSIRYFVGK